MAQGTPHYDFTAAPPPAPPGWRPRGLGNWGIFVVWFFLGVFSLFFTWYSTRITTKAKLVWTGLVVVQSAVATTVVVLALTGGGINTGKVEQFVRNDLPSSVSGVAGAPLDEMVSVHNVGCVQSTANTWACNATYSVAAPAENINQTFTASVDVTCDSSGSCSYPSFEGVPTNP